MSSHPPTEEQAEAIRSPHPKLVVRASAGSGKTRVLVSRFLRLVHEEDLPGDSILVLTFGTKAASEMKERIIHALLDQGLRTEAQEAEMGPISTFHSFCERLLKENSLAAGLDPDFQVLSDRDSEFLRVEANRTAMVRELEEEGPASWLIARYGLNARRGRPSEGGIALTDSVGQVIEHMEHRLASPEDLRQLGSSAPGLAGILLRHGIEDLGLTWKGLALVEEVEEAKASLKESRRQIPRWLTTWTEQAALREAEASAALCLLAASTWEEADSMQRQRQAFSFGMLESLALNLLKTSQATRQRIRESVRAVLVDESQDLNPIQHAIVEELGVERVMMVGDPQQSIYGFRHADRRLFMSLSSAWPTLPLSRNFRSRGGILHFVDWIFGARWKGEYQKMAPPEPPPGPDSPFGSDLPYGSWEGVEIWDAPKGREVAFVVDCLEKDLKEGVWPGSVALLAHRAADLEAFSHQMTLRKIPHLVEGKTKAYYARMEVRDVANALQAIADPSSGPAWQAFLLGPFCELSLDAVALLFSGPFHPGDLAAFTSPAPEDGPKLERLMEWLPNAMSMASRWTAWELLSELLARSPLLVNLARGPQGREMIASVRQLFAIAASSPEEGPLEFAEGVRETQKFEHKAEDARAFDRSEGLVTLMTFHRSKGLEFPYVIVDSAKAFPSKQDLMVARDCPAPALKLDAPGPGHAMLAEARSKDEAQELERVLYVAFTRAQEKLCVVAGDSKNPFGTILGGLATAKRRQAGLVVRSGKDGGSAPDRSGP